MKKFFLKKLGPRSGGDSPSDGESPRSVGESPRSDASGLSVFETSKPHPPTDDTGLTWERIIGLTEGGGPCLTIETRLSAHGLVYLASSPDGKKYVVKCMARPIPRPVDIGTKARRSRKKAETLVPKKSKETLAVERAAAKDETKRFHDCYFREKIFLENVVHHNIPRLIVELTKGVDLITGRCMVMSYADGVDLFNLLEEYDLFPILLAKRIYRDVLTTLKYIHSQGYYHRDIKLENIIYDARTDRIKIIDWKLAENDIVTKAEPMGSIYYVAPEVIALPKDMRDGSELHYAPGEFSPRPRHVFSGPVNDVWSASIVLYVLLCKEMPYEKYVKPDGSEDVDRILAETVKHRVRYDRPFLPRETVGLLRSIFTIYTFRPTIDMILESEWMARETKERAFFAKGDCEFSS